MPQNDGPPSAHSVTHRRRDRFLGNLKISDFGLSSLYTSDDSRSTLLHTTCGTPNYVAPEVLADKGYDGRAADIWSCGVILYVLVAGFLPFDEPTMSALFRKIQEADYTYPAWFTDSLKDTLDRILVADPKLRCRPLTGMPGDAGMIDVIQSTEWYLEGGGPPPVPRVEEEGVDVSNANLEPQANGTEDCAAFKEQDEATVDASDEIEATEPSTMTAFDLINLCGGRALNQVRSSARRTGLCVCILARNVS